MESDSLFDLSSYTSDSLLLSLKGIDVPIWTRNKANFIARYLKQFTFVTKHGTYIDAFAGPQDEESRNESWAVKLVLENEPVRLRKFYLFDFHKKQIEHLKQLRIDYLNSKIYKDAPNKPVIEIIHGDCNVTLPSFLKQRPIPEKEATFCLLDQHTTQCDWETVKFIASYKGNNGGNKIELFYFFADGWIDRAIKSWRKAPQERALKWWGNGDVMEFLRLPKALRGFHFAERFKQELGYKYAMPYPILREGKSGRLMFWMIHASDHHRAPVLMSQSYHYAKAGNSFARITQRELWPAD